MKTIYTQLRTISTILLLIVLSCSVKANNGGLERPDLAPGFLENKGQMLNDKGQPASDVLFRCSAPGLDLFLTNKGITYLFSELEEEEEEEGDWDGEKEMKRERKLCRIDMVLKGANILKENARGEQALSGEYNYYLGHCPQGIVGVRKYAKVTISDVYPGIDWVLYTSGDGLKYDFIVNAGADPSLISLLYKGGRKKVKEDEILIHSALGNIKEGKLYCYQGEKEVSSAYQLKEGAINIVMGSYDKSNTLVIDPPLAWSTLFGGSSVDGPLDLTTDNNGNVYITGYTGSADMPTVNPGGGAYFQAMNGGDAFITKFSNSGALQWCTFYGGSDGEYGHGLACDAAGNLYLTGWSNSSNLPVLNAYQGSNGGTNFTWDAFLAKFNGSGAMQWATYYGGSGKEEAHSVNIDANGNIHVAGITNSTNFPTKVLAGAFMQTTFGGATDAYLLRFSPTGTCLWATYYGGTFNETFSNGYGVVSLASDKLGNIYMAGNTASANCPMQNMGGAYNQGASGGMSDIFINRFNANGALTWGTFFGGSYDEAPWDLVSDNCNNIYLTGWTNSGNFPVKNMTGAFNKSTISGIRDLFVLKFNSACANLWATYYGGTSDDLGYDMCTDNCANLYISGRTYSNNFPLQNSTGAYYQGAFGGGSFDTYLLHFTLGGSLVSSSFIGSNADDWTTGMACDPSCRLYITGESTGAFVINNQSGSFNQAANNGAHDGFLMKFLAPAGNAVLTANVIKTDITCNGLNNGAATASVSGGVGPYSYLWSPGNSSAASVSGLSTGTYSVTVTDANCTTVTASGVINQPLALQLSASATNAICNAANGSATLSVSGGTGSYTYSWSNASTTATTTGLSAGSYTVAVTDANGCSKTAAVTVGSSIGGTAGIISTNVSCFGASNGIATATMTGGTSPYTFAWSSGQFTATASGLGTGAYTVTVTDANGCISQATVSIAQPTAITATATATAASCGQSNGTASVTASGGTGNFTYSWSNGATQSTINNLQSTIYTVTVTDANGCSKIATVTVGSNSGGTATATATAASCFGANNGTAAATMTGGTGPYTYSWSTGATQSSISNLQSAIYTVAITDANGCSSTATVNVSQPTALTVAATATATSCGQNNGTASVTANGGTGSYNYSWSNGAIQSTINNLQSAIYTVTITDVNGCSNTATCAVGASTKPVASFSMSDSAACGQVCVTFTNTSSNASSQAWTFGDGGTSNSLSPKHCYSAPGNYTVTLVVADNSGCTATITKTNAVNVFPNPVADFVANPWSTTMLNPLVNFTDQSNGAISWEWNFFDDNSGSSIQNPSHTYRDTGCFNASLKIMNQYGCSDSIAKPVCVRGEYTFYAPNAFTPSHPDGLNDKFFPKGTGIDEGHFEFMIFDRWGNLIWETTVWGEGWDGRANGGADIAQMDVYVWKARTRELYSGREHKYIGHVSLVR